MKEKGHRIRGSDSREKLRFYRFAGETVILLGIITGVTMALSQIGILVDLEQTIDDIGVAQFTADQPAPHPRVVVVAIDDDTIAELPARSPVNRVFLAKLL